MARDEGGGADGGTEGGPVDGGAPVARERPRSSTFPDPPADAGRADAAAAQGAGGHPRLGGALRLPAERPGDRRRGRADVHLVGAPPAAHARAQGLPAPRPATAPARSTSAGRTSPRPTDDAAARSSVEGQDSAAGPLARRPSRRSCRCSATSPPVGRSSPSRPCRASSRCPARSSARARCSCSTSGATRWSTRRSRDGDWVVVRQQPVAENGEIVAAMIDGEATVKTLQPPRRARLADAGEPGVRPDPGRRGDGARPGRGGAAPALTAVAGPVARPAATAAGSPRWPRHRPAASSAERRRPAPRHRCAARAASAGGTATVGGDGAAAAAPTAGRRASSARRGGRRRRTPAGRAPQRPPHRRRLCPVGAARDLRAREQRPVGGERDRLALRLVGQRHPHRRAAQRRRDGVGPVRVGHGEQPRVGVGAQRDDPPVGADRCPGDRPRAEAADRAARRVRRRQHQRRRRAPAGSARRPSGAPSGR